MRTDICLECKTELNLSDYERGDLFACPKCGWELEVLSVEPPMATYSDAVWDDGDEDE